MLKRKENNSGMSLIEVIVSMLVLSIAVVTVMSAFSMAIKVNAKTKQMQSTESLMENMLEYAEAGGTDFQAWFDVDAANYTFSESGSVKEETLRQVKEGFQTYTVKVKTDTAPAEYAGTQMNNYDVIRLGGAGSSTLVIDVSNNDDDSTAHNVFLGFHEYAVDLHNELEEQKKIAEPTYDKVIWNKKTLSDVEKIIDREIHLEVVPEGTNKMKLKVSKVYTLAGTLEMPDGYADYTYTVPCFVSDEFDSRTTIEATPKFLEQVYLIYPATSKEEATCRGIDVRILDASQLLREDTTFFLVNQVKNNQTVSVVYNASSRSGDFENLNIKVSCRTKTGGIAVPRKIQVYSPLIINKDEPYGEVDVHSNDLVAAATEVRIVKVTLEVYDEEEAVLLETKEITRLQ